MRRHEESGLSVLATLVILSTVTMAAYSMIETQIAVSKAHRNSATMSEINTFYRRVRNILNTQWACTASLSGQNYHEPIGLKDPINPNSWIATAGMASNPFWKMGELQFQNVQNVPGSPGVFVADLEMQLSKNIHLQTGAPLITQLVPRLFFGATPDGVITQCYPSADALATAQAACNVLGGVWDATKSYSTQCALPPSGGKPHPSPSPSIKSGPAGLCTDPNTGYVAVAKSSMAISGNGKVISNLYLLGGAKLTLSGNATVAGALFEDAGASYTTQGNAAVSSYLQTNLSDLSSSLQAFVVAEAALAPTQKLSGISGNETLSGNGGKNVIQVTGDISLTGKGTLTLSGTSHDTFVIIVSGRITISGNASILLAGGVPPQNVVVINVGSGNEIVVGGNGSVSGTFIGLGRGLQVSGNGKIQGAFVAGGGVNTKVTVSGNGLAMKPSPYCVYQ